MNDTLIREKPPEAAENLAAVMADIGGRERVAASRLALASADAKTAALRAGAQAIRDRAGEILAANTDDIAEAKRAGISAALIDRLALDEKRLEGVAKGLHDIAALPAPAGRVLEPRTRPNWLHIGRGAVRAGVD